MVAGEGKVFDDINNSLKETVKLLNIVQKETRDLAKVYSNDLTKSVNKLDPSSSFKDVDKVHKYNNALKSTNKQTKELTAYEKELILERNKLGKIVAKRQVQESDLTRLIEEQTLKQKHRLKQIKAEARVATTVTGTLARHRAELSELSLEYEHASASIQKKLIPQMTMLRASINRADQAVGNHSGDVGRYQKAWEGVRGVWMKAGGIIMAVGMLVRGFVKLMNISIKFRKEMSKVEAITGKTKSEMKELSAQAIKLGGATKFTATNVAELYTELARLGFTVSEISLASEAILDLGAATDESLASVASTVGSVVRAFGLHAGESVRVADVAAKAFSSTALTLENYTEAMKLIAPVALKANISVELTTALLGKLADSGLKGSISGTGLKNVMSKLSNESSKLSKEIGFAVKNDNDLIKALSVMETKHVNLARATELTDERSKAAFLTLVGGIDTVTELHVAFDKAQGSAKDIADVMQNNLSGSMVKATSAWEKMILSIDEGNSKFSKGIRQTVDQYAMLFNYIGDLASDDPLAVLKTANQDLIRSNRELHDDMVILTGVYAEGTDGKEAYMLALNDELSMVNALKDAHKNQALEMLKTLDADDAQIQKQQILIWAKNEEIKKIKSLISAEENRIKLQKEADLVDSMAQRAKRIKEEAQALADFRKEHDALFKSQSKTFVAREKFIDSSREALEVNFDFTEQMKKASDAVVYQDSVVGKLSESYDNLKNFIGSNSQEIQDTSDIISNVSEVYTNLTREQFETATRNIEQYNTKISDLESNLEQSLNDQALGMANNVDNEIEQINKLKQARQSAIDEQAKLVKRQRTLNLIAQVSNIGVAVSKIFNTNADIPIVGVIKAVSEIAVMLSTLASSKQQAQSYADGGEVHGAGTTTSDSIPANLSDKEFVTKAKAYKNAPVTTNLINDMKLGDSEILPALQLAMNPSIKDSSIAQNKDVMSNTYAIKHLTSVLIDQNQNQSKSSRIRLRNGQFKYNR